MNAREHIETLDLAAYELAEAERHERAAKAHRQKALQLLAQSSQWAKEAMKKATKPNPEK